MKLKKLFSVRTYLFAIIFAAGSCFFISCSSNKIAVPIPGQGDAVQKNIYVEYLNIADTYFSLEKYDKAESYYKTAMGNKEIYWTAYYKLAKCYVYESKWGEAQTIYEEMLKRDPENNTIKSSIAYIYAMNGNTDNAITLYEELIENNPDVSEYLENYICILLACDKKEEAEIQFNTFKEKFSQSKRVEEFSKLFEEEPTSTQ